jgi:hypothetical protein
MGLRWPLSERRGTEEPPWSCGDKVTSQVATHLGAQLTCQTKVQRADNANSRTGS